MSNDSGESDVTPTESETTGTVGNFPHGSRETPVTSVSLMEAERSEKARGHNSDMHGAGESHSSIVPKKPANKGLVPRPAESVEGRELTKENTEQSLLDRTQSRNSDGRPFEARSRGLPGVRAAARQRAVCRSISKVRTVCGSSARTDLCGGRSVMTVPTAIDVLFAQSRQFETTRRRAWAACSCWHSGGGFGLRRRRFYRCALRRYATAGERLR